MGTFRVSIDIGDPAGQRRETVEALVDTGATYTTIPAPILGRLGVVPHVRDTFVLADGRRADRDIGRAWVRVDGREELTLVVFGDPDAPVLLGAYTLEGLRLAADPVGRRLVPVPGLLLGSYSCERSPRYNALRCSLDGQEVESFLVTAVDSISAVDPHADRAARAPKPAVVLGDRPGSPRGSASDVAVSGDLFR